MLRPADLPFLIALAALALGTSSCAVTKPGSVTISKVNPYHLTSSTIVSTEDGMTDFEQRRYLYGAVTNDDFAERYGNYFTIFWSSPTRNPATVRLDYRQGRTGPRVHTREVQIPSPRGKNTTKFEIIGDDYQEFGKVTQWKASIVENGVVVAEYESFLWSQ